MSTTVPAVTVTDKKIKSEEAAKSITIEMSTQ